MQGRDRRVEGACSALEEGGLRGWRGMDRERLMSSDEPEYQPDYQYDPIRHGTPWRERVKKLLGPAIGLIILLGKWGIVLLKFSSIFIAFGGYALLFCSKF